MPAVGAAIGAFATSVTTAIAGSTFLTGVVGRLLISVAASALLNALAPKPRAPGIKTEVTQTGGTNPLSFILMTYATAGTRLCPPMSHGRSGDTPNAYLTEVIAVSDIPGTQLKRLIINDEYVTLGTTPHPDYGLPVLGSYDGFCWIKFYDGSQTAADPMLLAKYASYPERPWSADMIGRGVAYAIITCRYKRKVFNSTPRFRFEVEGIPLYDPRKDTTVGGSGTHRWANKATWQATTNPMVASYNILRGISLLDGSVWGGGFAADRLPLSPWFTAMNECDVLVNNGAGGTEAQFRAGLEVSVDEEPADILAELEKACGGQLVEVAGQWKPRVGPPGLSVFSITDGDIVISREQELEPFPGFTASFNAVHATYPEPAQIWNEKEAPPLYNATWEAEDQDQRLVANLALPAVPYGAQVIRLMEAYIKEERRFRRHGLALPPDAAVLEPLDALAWTSTKNGYTAKVFEVAEVEDHLMTGIQVLSLRERDAGDWVSSDPAPPPVVSVVPVVPPPQLVSDFAVSGISIPDATGAARRPAILMTWEPELEDVTAILWEVRVQATGVIVASGSFQNVAAGEGRVTEGILAATAYEVRSQPVADRPVDWTAWTPVTTPSTLITAPDLAEGSVTLPYQTVVLGPLTWGSLPNGTVVATLDLGQILPGQGWERRVSFEARKAVATITGFFIDLERRRAVLGGGLGAWSVQSSFTVGGTAWDVYGSAGTISEPVDDFEYRLVVRQRPDGSAADQLLRNVYITLARVTK